MNTNLQQVSSQRVYSGEHQQFTHDSTSLNCAMRFAIFMPPQASTDNKVPVLYWLSGLTCNDENFMQKAGALRIAAKLGMAIVAPDTSPRGTDFNGVEVADDENAAYDLGLGAGFYINATQAPWDKHYKMYDYIVDELPSIIEANFPVSNKRSISGHSMGGHGALMISLKHPERYASASAFSPICQPTTCPWGQKAFTAYLGNDEKNWQAYDSSLLMRNATDATQQVPTLVSQGSSDNFLQEQLNPEALQAAALESQYPLTFDMELGYDHSYYFISSFINDHLKFHGVHLEK